MTDFDPEKLKHKPNEKHTLDEVLKSLQDLIHNDLLHGAGKPAGTPAAPSETGAAPTASESETPTHPGSSGSVPLESVVESLEELVAKDLADDSMDGGGTTLRTKEVERRLEQPPGAASGTVADDDRASNDTSEQIAREPELPASSAAKKPDSAQQAFGFDDDWNTPAASPAAEPAASPPVENTADFEIETPTPEAEPSPDFDIPTLTQPVSAERFTDDDIPVLENVAAAGEMSTAHDIAERVVAQLNAERQARGEPALDAGVLEALRALLREELERHFPE